MRSAARCHLHPNNRPPTIAQQVPSHQKYAVLPTGSRTAGSRALPETRCRAKPNTPGIVSQKKSCHRDRGSDDSDTLHTYQAQPQKRAQTCIARRATPVRGPLLAHGVVRNRSHSAIASKAHFVYNTRRAEHLVTQPIQTDATGLTQHTIAQPSRSRPAPVVGHPSCAG